MASGIVTRGRRVGIRGLGHQIRPIHSGILTRRGEQLSAAAREFVNFIVSDFRQPATATTPAGSPGR
jgi:hypothetical protein